MFSLNVCYCNCLHGRSFLSLLVRGTERSCDLSRLNPQKPEEVKKCTYRVKPKSGAVCSFFHASVRERYACNLDG